MKLKAFYFLLFLLFACGGDVENDTSTSVGSDTSVPESSANAVDLDPHPAYESKDNNPTLTEKSDLQHPPAPSNSEPVMTTGDDDSVEAAGDVVKAGVKYVTGDLTFNVGFASGTAKDGTMGTAGTTDDSKDSTSASISYAVAAGVTAILGYTDVDSADEGSNDDTDGSAWYIGANMSF